MIRNQSARLEPGRRPGGRRFHGRLRYSAAEVRRQVPGRGADPPARCRRAAAASIRSARPIRSPGRLGNAVPRKRRLMTSRGSPPGTATPTIRVRRPTARSSTSTPCRQPTRPCRCRRIVEVTNLENGKLDPGARQRPGPVPGRRLVIDVCPSARAARQLGSRTKDRRQCPRPLRIGPRRWARLTPACATRPMRRRMPATSFRAVPRSLHLRPEPGPPSPKSPFRSARCCRDFPCGRSAPGRSMASGAGLYRVQAGALLRPAPTPSAWSAATGRGGQRHGRTGAARRAASRSIGWWSRGSADEGEAWACATACRPAASPRRGSLRPGV